MNFQSSHDDDGNRSMRISGLALPKVFQDRLDELQRQSGNSSNTTKTEPGSSSNNDAASNNKSTSQHDLLSRHGIERPKFDKDRVFTVAELQNGLRQTSQAILLLQKQIQRGEEVYFEETQSTHGSSLFKGFDTYIDSRADPSSSSSMGGTRRMPGDYRWFSSSCSNLARHIQMANPEAPPTFVPQMERVILTPEQVAAAAAAEQSLKKTPKNLKAEQEPAPAQPKVPASGEKRPPNEQELGASPRPKKEAKKEKVAETTKTSPPPPAKTTTRSRPSRKRKGAS